MKRYIYSLVLFCLCLSLTFVSCKKSEDSITKSTTSKIVKEFSVSDGKGNTAAVIVSGLHEKINSFSNESFEIVTITEDFTLGTQENYATSKPNGSKVPFSNWTEENTILIDVVDFKLQDGVIGFRVDLKPEFKSTTERWDQTFLQYGSNGTRGAMASYLAQTCSNEELDLDLDKKTSSSNWAYQDLSEAYFQQPVSSWSYCNAVGFSSYRFRFEFEDDCSTTLTTAQRISWAWMTTTSCP